MPKVSDDDLEGPKPPFSLLQMSSWSIRLTLPLPTSCELRFLLARPLTSRLPSFQPPSATLLWPRCCPSATHSMLKSPTHSTLNQTGGSRFALKMVAAILIAVTLIAATPTVPTPATRRHHLAATPLVATRLAATPIVPTPAAKRLRYPTRLSRSAS